MRAAVLLVAVVAADWGALDEYTPLLALDTGVGAQAVPLLLLLLWAGVTVGGLLAPVGERLGGRGYAALLGLVGVALAGGALLRHPAGFVLLAVAFGAAQLATVLADARLQARITGTSRATVTSLAGMATDVLIIVTYAGYGLLATAAGNAVAFALTAGAYLVVALVLLTRRRRRTAAPTGVAAAVPPGLTGARRRPPRAAAGPALSAGHVEERPLVAVEVPEAAHVHRPLAIPGPSDSPPATAARSTSSSTCRRLDADSPTTTSRLVAVSVVATPVYASKPERRCSTRRAVSEMVSTVLSPSGSAWSLVKPIARKNSVAVVRSRTGRLMNVMVIGGLRPFRAVPSARRVGPASTPSAPRPARLRSASRAGC